MQTRRVILEVLPSRLTLACVRNGRVVEHRTARPEASDFAARWPEGLASLRGMLAEWVNAMKLHGAPVTVLYSAPSATCVVHSCPAAAGRHGAVRAAELAVRETGSFSPSAGTLDLLPLLCDPSTIAGREAQRHTLAVGDAHASTRALADWAQSAGLAPTQFIPHDAPTLMLALESATKAHGAGTPDAFEVFLWFGEHTCAVAAGSGGALRFIRSVPIGTESLTDVLCRPLRSKRDDASAGAATPAAHTGLITLDRATARRLLHTAGIPAPGTVADAALGLDATAVLPVMQPVLQRLAIELKQSLRFGLSESERASARLRLCGPGSFVPRLAQTLGQQVGILTPTSETTELPGVLVGDPGSGGAITAWAAVDRCRINLLPDDLETQLTLRRTRTFAWAGMVGAAALIALYAGTGWLTLRTERQRLEAMRLGPGGNGQEQSLQLSAKRSQEQLDQLRARVDSEMGQSPPVSATLAALAQIAPSEVRFTAIVLEGESGTTRPEGPGGTCAIEALALTDDPQRLAVILRDLTLRLEALPIVRSVRLGATQRTEQRGTPAQRFDLSIALNALPPRITAVHTGAAP
ncbi:MAG: hypothetical protein ACT4PL_05410 [Phycisphaerales bacterium]